MIVGQFLELRRYRWESVLEIDSRKKKFKRCLLQFTPESWGRLDWLHGNYRHPIGRTLALFIIMMLWQIVELNTFFSKHFFRYPGKSQADIFLKEFLDFSFFLNHKLINNF